MQKPALVVLAAGIGSRYGGLKQMEPVGPRGELIIDYSVYDALEAGFAQVVFVIQPAMEEAFRERVGRPIERHCATAYAFQRLDALPSGFQAPVERQKPWGTAHAVLCCSHLIRTPFAVINADDFYGRSSFEVLCRFLQESQGTQPPYEYAMVGYLLENTLTEYGQVARGVCSVDANGYLVEIHERLRIEKCGDGARFTEDGETWVELAPGTVVSMNMWGFAPTFFGELDARFSRFLQEHYADLQRAEFLLPDVVDQLLRERQASVRVLPTSAQWFGVTYQQDKPMVRDQIRGLVDRGHYPQDLWRADPAARSGLAGKRR